MAKNHKKGAGVKLVGNPSELINTILKDAADRKDVTAQVTEHGPKHKQVLNALLLRRLYKLVRTIEEKTGKEFSEQKGFTLTVGKEEDEMQLPFAIPVNVSSGFDKKKIIKAISKAPAHEALTFTISLQVIEWAINSLAKAPKVVSKKKNASAQKNGLQIVNNKMLDGVMDSNGISDKEWKDIR